MVRRGSALSVPVRAPISRRVRSLVDSLASGLAPCRIFPATVGASCGPSPGSATPLGDSSLCIGESGRRRNQKLPPPHQGESGTRSAGRRDSVLQVAVREETRKAELKARNACRRYCSFQNRSPSTTHSRGYCCGRNTSWTCTTTPGFRRGSTSRKRNVTSPPDSDGVRRVDEQDVVRFECCEYVERNFLDPCGD